MDSRNETAYEQVCNQMKVLIHRHEVCFLDIDNGQLIIEEQEKLTKQDCECLIYTTHKYLESLVQLQSTFKTKVAQ